MKQISTECSCHKQSYKRVIGSDFSASMRASLKALVAKYKFARQIANERHTLRNLSDYQLRDIGLTREQIRIETNRKFYDLPGSRCIGVLQGGLQDVRRQRIYRLPQD